jgi:hypothetical protein
MSRLPDRDHLIALARRQVGEMSRKLGVPIHYGEVAVNVAPGVEMKVIVHDAAITYLVVEFEEEQAKVRIKV